jgi:hypothetical protein
MPIALGNEFSKAKFGSVQYRRLLSFYVHRSMIIAVPAMWMMQMAVDQVVGMIAVRDRLMSAARAVNMCLIVPACRIGSGTTVGIRSAYRKGVFIDNIVAHHMVQATVVKIIDMAVMQDGYMTASGTVHMSVIRVLLGSFHSSLRQRGTTTLAKIILCRTGRSTTWFELLWAREFR